MIATLAKNKAGAWCKVLPGDEYQSYPTRAAAELAVSRANAAAVRIAEQRAAFEIAQGKLAALSRRLGVGIAILPKILPSSTSLAHMRECVRG